METVETIERRMKIQRIIFRIIIGIFILLLCLLVGWLISAASYDGLEEHSLRLLNYNRSPLLGHA